MSRKCNLILTILQPSKMNGATVKTHDYLLEDDFTILKELKLPQYTPTKGQDYKVCWPITSHCVYCSFSKPYDFENDTPHHNRRLKGVNAGSEVMDAAR